MNFIDLDRKDYKAVWELQLKLHHKRLQGLVPDTVLLVEHNHVITIGRSGKEKNVLLPRKLLLKKGVDYYDIERGGDVTYHGPGQLVGYPVFNIKDGLIGIKPYIEKLEDVIVNTLDGFGIQGRTRDKMVGVWTDSGKICSIGIAVKRWVTFHGFALNVNTDLSYFNLIVPCGLKSVNMTSMQEILEKEIPLAEVKQAVMKSFQQVFHQEVHERCLASII